MAAANAQLVHLGRPPALLQAQHRTRVDLRPRRMLRKERQARVDDVRLREEADLGADELCEGKALARVQGSEARGRTSFCCASIAETLRYSTRGSMAHCESAGQLWDAGTSTTRRDLRA